MNSLVAALASVLALSAGGSQPAHPTVSAARSARPSIIWRPVPYGPRRRQEMAAYSARHYGVRSNRLFPRVIVEHWTQTTSAGPVFSEFSADVRDSELGELPGLCAHFVIDSQGRIYNLVPLNLMCRHTVGLNDHAIGIEHVGMSDSSVMDNRAQLSASIHLTRWLRCRFHILPMDIIGHSESLSSRWHHELVPSLRGQTHGDMSHSTMQSYRRLIKKVGC